MKILSFGILYLALITLSPSAYAQQSNRSGKPNVIYIFADDLGYGDIGPYGQKKIKTPNLDRLAAQGMRFTQHYVGTPVCAPSRCNLMTGRNAGKAYIRSNYGLPGYQENKNEPGSFPIPANTPTLGTLFKQAGYVTAAIGKWGLGNHDNSGDPQKNGFDLFYGYYDQRHAHNFYTTHLYKNGKWDSLDNPVINVHPRLQNRDLKPEDVEQYTGNEYAPDRMTEEAIQFMNNSKDKPFFLYLAYTQPHAALQAPKAEINRYIKELDEKPHLLVSNYVPTFYPFATYAAMITNLDKQVGLVEAQLVKLGLDKNTIIMFCSDNGPANSIGRNDNYFNSTASLRGAKLDMYEGGVRVPFIVKWPGKVAPGKVNDHISATYDMMATFADLLKLKAPENDGISLLPTLLGKGNQKKHEYLYWEMPEKGGQVAIRKGKWKAVKVGVTRNPQVAWQLYDLDADVKESVNVADKNPELLKEFDRIVKKEHTTPVRKEWDIFNPVAAAGAGDGE
jgi:arylsulfatase A